MSHIRDRIKLIGARMSWIRRHIPHVHTQTRFSHTRIRLMALRSPHGHTRINDVSNVPLDACSNPRKSDAKFRRESGCLTNSWTKRELAP
jgi:hypothetical protein